MFDGVRREIRQTLACAETADAIPHASPLVPALQAAQERGVNGGSTLSSSASCACQSRAQARSDFTTAQSRRRMTVSICAFSDSSRIPTAESIETTETNVSAW